MIVLICSEAKILDLLRVYYVVCKHESVVPFGNCGTRYQQYMYIRIRLKSCDVDCSLLEMHVVVPPLEQLST